MTTTELDDIATIKAVSALIDLNPDASATTKAETAIRTYLAAIGAGGQAVADEAECAVRFGAEIRRRNRVGEDDERGSISKDCEHAAMMLVINAIQSCGGLSALSQPHPADERVVEALTKATGVIDTLIESLSEELMTDAGLLKADRVIMKHKISALELAKDGIAALFAKEGRKNG